jgi:putative phosphoesterase
MKLAILSDTHGNYPLAVKVLESLGQLDYIIHLGDTTDDAEMIELALGRELIKLSGNCDTSKKYPELIITTIAGKKVLLSHGDQFMVKSGLNLIQQRVKQEKADVVLYGHTHRPAILSIEDVLFINPGTMNRMLPSELSADISDSDKLPLKQSTCLILQLIHRHAD